MNNLIRPLIALLLGAGSIVSSVIQARARVAAARAPFEPPSPTAQQVFGAITAAAEDFLNACKLGDIPPEEAKRLWREQLRANAAVAVAPPATASASAGRPVKRSASDVVGGPLGSPYGTPGRNPYRD